MKIGIELTPGLVSDDTSYASQATFRKADKIRFVKGKPEIVGGWERLTQKTISGVCRTILSWKDNQGQANIAFGTHSHLLIYRNGRLVDITPAGYEVGNINGGGGNGYGTGGYSKGPYGQVSSTEVDYGPRIWSMSNFGQSLVANPRLGQMYLWENDLNANASLVSAIAGSKSVPPKVGLTLVTKERQLLAFGCNELISGDYNPLAIRGSDIDGNIHDWSITAANNAFEDILPNGGSIVAAKIWGDNVAVLTQGGLYSGVFIGDPSQTYRFDAVDGALGCLGPNAATVVGQTLFWLTPDAQLWAAGSGGSAQRLVCPIAEDTLENIAINQYDKVTLTYIPTVNELRIDYPDARDGLENSRYVTLSLEEDAAWSQGIMSRTAFERGNAYNYPLGAQTFTRNLVYGGDIVDNASAVEALNDITDGLGLENNIVQQSQGVVGSGGALVANVSLPNERSGWGMRLTGDGSTVLEARIASLGLLTGQKVSVSYKATVVVGRDVTLAARFATRVLQNVPMTGTSQIIRHENVTVNTGENFSIYGTLPAGVVVEITDIKIEYRSQASDWSPSRSDSNLFTAHYKWLTTTAYPQIVGDVYYHEKGFTADGGNIDWMIETNDFALDEDETVMMVRGFITDFKDQQGDVELTVFLRMYPNDPDEEYGPFILTDRDNRADFLASGKLGRFRLEGSSSPARLRLGRPLIDVVKAGSK
jgi:hypothetical protein